ncbi:MAG: TrkH family potassium uptake protein [Peptoniphilaceae bacterium]|nr:TrkH family potassium uptake protein [Peptoniphilaceae bacterium]MDY6085970.1 TrkH family potassium uptake protein [Peptoniphilaceae bacterium]
MNRSIVRFIVGRVFAAFALLLCFPLGVSLFYGENATHVTAWLIAIGLSLGCYLAFGRKKPSEMTFYAREGMVICALLWILFSFVGGLPLYLTGEYPSLVDSFFEISSGLTTTGASVAQNVEVLSHSVIFWRSFTHLIGGMGVLVFFLALIPRASSSSVQIAKAEMPGPSFGKLVARLSDTARILYGIYLGMTTILILLLVFAGMPLFDSICHAFGTAGTGGFGIKAASIGYYTSPAIQWIITIGMFVFGVNMNLYYFVLIGKARKMWEDEEFRWFLRIVLGMTGLIVIDLIARGYMTQGFEPVLRDAAFSLSSIISTTGYATADFAKWPLFSRVILMLAMIIGGCGGSTAGGFKVSRIAISLKAGLRSLVQTRHPRHVVPLQFNGETMNASTQKQLHGYTAVYIVLAILLLLIVTLDANTDSLETAMTTVLATFNNVGPGLGNVVGPTGNYFGFSPITKLVLSFGMIAGRLELWPVLILFAPKTWRKH